MKKSGLSALILSAALCLNCLGGCGKAKDSSSSEKDDKNVSSAAKDSKDSSSSEKEDKNVSSANEDSKGSSSSEKDDKNAVPGDGEIIIPDEDSEEYDLGSYRISENGVKLYYEDSEYPGELISTLEKYFKSFETGDYDSYKECLFPSYIDAMESYLQENYQYGLDQSFQTQCDNLNVNMGGSFEITRIKAEKPIDVESEEVGADEFLDNLSGFFDSAYKESVKNDSDALRYMTFSVMAKDTDETESLLVSSFYILFAEKDGKYYTFG